MAAGQLLALLCLGLIFSVTEVTSQSRSSSDSTPARCSVPNWPARLGEDPVASNRGKVVLVALMKGYCSYCVGQATNLDRLKAHLYRYGIRDIAMVIVNGGEDISRARIANLEGAGSLPVIQDTEDHIMYSQIFQGNKDDFIVYDRCGQRSAWIPHPYSYLGHTITERILRAVHSGAHTCHCSLDRQPRNPHDVMYGDQPAGPGYGVVGTVTDSELDLDCPHGDRWCRRYQRNFRRHHWDYRSNVHRARLSNRPRLRGHLQGEQEGRDFMANGRGGHHHRQHEGRNHGAGQVRIQFGSAP